jgi:hypothetical protein
MNLKLPGFLPRFRKKAVSADPVATMAVPDSPVITEPAKSPSRFDRLNHWLTLGANIGVLLGLAVLIVEVRQNASLTRTAMDQQKNDLLAEIEFNIAKPEITDIWVKAIRAPEELSDAEIRTIDSLLISIMLQWDQVFMMQDAGLISETRVRQHIQNTAPFYFGSRFGKHWWALQINGWEGTAMQQVAGPIVEALDEDFLDRHLDKLKLLPSEELTTDPEMPE